MTFCFCSYNDHFIKKKTKKLSMAEVVVTSAENAFSVMAPPTFQLGATLLQPTPMGQVLGQHQGLRQEARGQPQADSAPTTPGHYDQGLSSSGYQTPALGRNPGLASVSSMASMSASHNFDTASCYSQDDYSFDRDNCSNSAAVLTSELSMGEKSKYVDSGISGEYSEELQRTTLDIDALSVGGLADIPTHPIIKLSSSVQDPIDKENNFANEKKDIGERVFLYFLHLRLQEENIELNKRNESQDLSEEIQSAVRGIIERLKVTKGRTKVWKYASRIKLQSLSKEGLRSLFLSLFEKASHFSKWLLFFFLTDVIIISTRVMSVKQVTEEHLILWSCELIRDLISPYVRDNSGWKFFLFIRSEDPMTDSGTESESEYEDVDDYHGTFRWNSEMDSIVNKTLRRAVTKEKKYKDQRTNCSYKNLWTHEFRRYFPSYKQHLNNKTKHLLRAKYSGSKKHRILKKHTIMSKKFLQYMKLSVQTLLTRKKTTTCDEVIKFIQDTKEEDLEMVSYKKRNVRRSINRAMDNFKKTGSTSRKHPGRPPCSDPLRKKIISLSRNKRYRRYK